MPPKNHRGGTTSTCPQCRTPFYRYPSQLKTFCSSACAYASRRGQPLSEAHLKAKTLATARGPRHFKWKGDAVGYSGLHAWVRKTFGKADHCERCRTSETFRYEWANITGRYERNRDDWMQLCVRCHRRMDADHRRLSKRFKARFIEQAEAQYGIRQKEDHDG